ncbi:hybrid sensor histidine kinase/response regulator [Hydrogenophaga sp.]|uniref:hybrid sensor histidine kinase/response regulator n=1 Tax=Hydrogenophaga sp. TaxID=1904254 RepID=UPI00271FA229|nr:hybrid sensor histidine kinase/response regulator [Hydrogenophaga sp.]MDO9434898.1 hybrid sensor histidine kinase/response regulator [Hydrogenophaga sp.]
MKPDETGVTRGSVGAHAILIVDDEPQACKWFARLYGDEFAVLTANGVSEALALLAERGEEVAVLLTDYAMPQRDGVSLLSEVRQRYPHIARLLVSAYADKDVAMSAVNEGHVEQILEKPLDEALTRRALRDALNASLVRARERALVERRSATLRETLGFLAHEVTTPLATVQGYLTAMRERHREAPADGSGDARIQEAKPGDVLFMIEAAQRRAEYAQSLVSTFVQTARDAYQPDATPNLRASDLVQAVRDEYPFDNDEAQWLSIDLGADFVLPGRRDLLYLVLCTLVKNALMALRNQPPEHPQVQIGLGREAPAPGVPAQAVIHVKDNGTGIPSEVLKRLTVEPTTTRAHAGGSGMGLIFCRRVMTSLGGSILIRSEAGQGATVSLYFPSAQ